MEHLVASLMKWLKKSYDDVYISTVDEGDMDVITIRIPKNQEKEIEGLKVIEYYEAIYGILRQNSKGDKIFRYTPRNYKYPFGVIRTDGTSWKYNLEQILNEFR